MINYIKSKHISYDTLEESKFVAEDKNKLTGEELGNELIRKVQQYEKKYKTKIVI